MSRSFEMSQQMRHTWLPQLESHDHSLSLPATTRSLRDDSTSCFAPASTKSLAVSSPSPPSPPDKKCAPLLSSTSMPG